MNQTTNPAIKEGVTTKMCKSHPVPRLFTLWVWLFIASLSLSFTAPTVSAQIKDFSDFSGIVILDQGRKKPLDTYARSTLLQFSSKSTYNGMSAVELMAQIFFKPDATRDYKIFMVNTMEALQALGLDLEADRKFSYNQLEPGVDKLRQLAQEIASIEEKQRSLVQNEILKLFQNINTYVRLASSFQFAIPSATFTIRNADLAGYMEYEPTPHMYSYYDVLEKATDLHKFLSALKSSNDSGLSDVDREVVRLSQEMYTWAKYYAGMPVPIIPDITNNSGERWLSPWFMLSNFLNQQDFTKEIGQLAKMVKAYLDSNQQGFSEAAAAFNANVNQRITGKIDVGHTQLELVYNKFDFFFWSKVLYVLGFLLVLLSYSFWARPLYIASWFALIAAILPHTIGIISRMIIMDRPPVTNLYETFLFVAWISVVVAIAGEWLMKKGTGTITAAVSGFSLLMVAQKYAMEGDTMGMLVAVLDSNFWLATHVVTITMGYAGCCAAGVAGHIYLLQKIFKADKDNLKDTFKSIYGMLAFGLIFSFIGTVLGGIWADQSWGRFWGWDPKENGALLIVLWCAILFHARMGGMVREVGFAAGSVLGGIIVMFAWFGVNLLGVGLHSYGFSSGVFVKLFSYYAFEILFVCITVPLINILENSKRK